MAFNNEYIQWYNDEKIAIFFSEIPIISVRYITPTLTKEEKKSVKKYPFINRKNLDVKIVDYKKNKTYKFLIPKNYCFDGATIPRIFWRIIGPNTDNSFLIPAMIHDVLCEHHEYIDNDRLLSTNIFNSLLKVSEVKSLKRFFMKNSVNFFQKTFCKW